LKAAIMHTSEVADEALHLSGDVSLGTQWYARRGSLSLIYAVAELHQMHSPETAPNFLGRLLNEARGAEATMASISQFGGMILDSWAGILKSRNLF